MRQLFFVLFILSFVFLFWAEVPYGTGKWDSSKLGNHRAVIEVKEKAEAVRVHVPWRRRDHEPGKKAVIVIDGRTGKRINNMYTAAVNREYGDIVFRPVSGPGTPALYGKPGMISASRPVT